MKLFDYQKTLIKEALKKMILSPGSAVYNASEPGTGKTIETLCMIKNVFRLQACEERLKQFGYGVIIVCPASLRYMWASAAEDYDLGEVTLIEKGSQYMDLLKPSDVTVIAHNTVIEPRIREILTKNKYGVLVVDEAHKIVSTNSKDVGFWPWPAAGAGIPE